MASKFAYYLSMLKRLRPLKAAPKVWNYCKYRSCARRPVTPCRRYTPQIAGLLVTKRCNLNCGYCNASKVLQDPNSHWRECEADLETIRRIFANRLFANSLLVDLLGGEPLLVKEFDRIVAYLTQRGHLTNTSTNGLLLAERIADLKQAGITRINVSVYDANKAVLERDLAKINRIFPVHASIVLLRSHVERSPEKLVALTQFLRQEGCRSLRFWMYRPMGVNPRPEEVIVDSDEAYLAFRRRIEETAPGFSLWPAVVDPNATTRRCTQLWQRISCDMQGNLFPCCGIDEPLSGPEGNLFRSDPDAQFNHPILVRMREQLSSAEEELPVPCKTCNLLQEPGW